MVWEMGWKRVFFTIFLMFFFGYMLCDEEPIFDLSDLNVFHLVWFVFSLMAVVFDNYFRISLGQYSDKDRSLWSYLVSYTLNLILYFLIIWFVFFLHVITPLNLNLTDDSSPFYSLIGFFSPIMFKNISAISILWLTALIFNRNRNSIFINYVLGLINFIFGVLLVYWVFDFLTTQITSTKKDIGELKNSVLVTNKSSATYKNDDFLNGFEWHLISDKGHLIGFVDFASILVWFLFLTWFLLFLFFSLLIYMASNPSGSNYIFQNNITGFFISMVSFIIIFYVLIFIVFFTYWFFILITTCCWY